jgi:tetratricopeptide (TPR) repeat protein
MDFCRIANNMPVDLNNKAVELIALGHYEEAISTLVNALQSSKQMIAEATEIHLPLQITLDDCMTESPAPICPQQDENEQQLFIYKRPIYICREKMALNYKARVLTSVVLIFNLSLAYQLSGTKNANAGYLKKAARLYQLAFQMPREEKFESTTLFSMACINNVALVYHELEEMSKKKKCFEHLLSTLMCLVDLGDQNVCELDGFFRNTFHLMVSKTPAAAA